MSQDDDGRQERKNDRQTTQGPKTSCEGMDLSRGDFYFAYIAV